MQKIYLGDGVYAKTIPGSLDPVILTTEDGISETNQIVLEEEVLRNFIEFLLGVGRL